MLGEKRAPKTGEEIWVDNARLEHADVAGAAGIAREVAASLRRD
jgi:hypothetical protein